MPEVPRVTTPLALDVAARELVRALRAHGEFPHREEARYLLAQIWLETGRGRSCNNHNVGNISVVASNDVQFWRPPWFEVTPESPEHLRNLHEQMKAGRAPAAFRDYPSFAAGFGDYVGRLLTRFRPIVDAARDGDGASVADAIQRTGYTVDAPPGIARSLDSLRDEFARGGWFNELPLVQVVHEGRA